MQILYDASMSNAKKFIPINGAFTLAAKRLGVTPQYVAQCWKAGGPLRVIDAVIKASMEIAKRKREERREYAAMIRKAAQLADEVNGLIE